MSFYIKNVKSSIYNSTMEIEKLPNMNLSKLNYYQLLSYTFNELFGKLDSYKHRRYTNLICYNNEFFWLYNVLSLDNNYDNCHFTVDELNAAKEKAEMSLQEKIKLYQLGPFNIHRNEYKEILSLEDMYGKYRYGKVEDFHLVDLQKKDINDVILKNYEYKYTHYDNLIRIDNPIIHKKYNLNNNLCLRNNISEIGLDNHPFYTLCWSIKADCIEDTCFYGNLLQAYLSHYGHSKLFKELRIKAFQLYHFSSYFDNECNLFFIHFSSDIKKKNDIKNSVINIMKNLWLSIEEFESIKAFLDIELRFLLDKQYGYNFYLFKLGQKYKKFAHPFYDIKKLNYIEFNNMINNMTFIALDEG
ncbi:insulinase family protein [Staphylococcus chromogenes]|uniref:insulinase family protein n=2 Tax=Staphylococcus chromogenes TaxID=46126 RepID=UPI001E2A5202|nr:insulinase family protein [Staphylococcus chromogenes]MCD8904028.1 insulinase family protein [Staphylococcus chromogenes]